MGLNKVVGLAARETPTGLARPFDARRDKAKPNSKKTNGKTILTLDDSIKRKYAYPSHAGCFAAVNPARKY
jgi:hypothetical protein